MQEKITLKAPDNKKIYGFWDGEKNNKLIVFVHGLTSSMARHLFFNAPKFFNPEGFDTFRFDLYSSAPDARVLNKCSLDDHVGDLNLVVKHFQKKYEEIFLIGHSFGGPVILHADLSSIQKIVLWDPSVKGSKKEKGRYMFNEQLQAYISITGVMKLISKQLIEA